MALACSLAAKTSATSLRTPAVRAINMKSFGWFMDMKGQQIDPSMLPA
ncbi:hypothetical protein [Prevotella nigrescens]|nr:hypothetical protein [Prevotella nigrescens]